ncbi:MAG: sigma-70 family RNA polymerase sigma factor [Clostridia bacterium]|nr:sigma-70 family RNA polymerase sigma factor [Clostridia bacterium]
MEGSKTEEKVRLSRTDADRILRGYGKMAEALRSSGTLGTAFGLGECFDETALVAQMYDLRSRVLLVEDTRERLLLYSHYIKGMSLEACARLLNKSRRTVYRLKNRALDSFIKIMERKNV